MGVPQAFLDDPTYVRAQAMLEALDRFDAPFFGFTPREARKNDELTTLRDDLAAKTRECTKLSHQLDAAATVIAALHHDNTLLRQELGQHGEIIALNAAPHRDNVTSHQRTGLSARRAPADHSLSTLKPRNPDVS